MIRSDYPDAVVEVLDDQMTYPLAVLEALRRFAEAGPWQGSLNSRKKKFQQLNQDLARTCRIKRPSLAFRDLGRGNSGASHYLPGHHRIVMVGKLSVVTFLHEFGHALGYGERDACQWSINLFRQCFPRQYAKLIHVRHTLIRPQDVDAGYRNERV